MAEVFVSYASPDREVAQKIAAFLEGEGVSCWIAPRDVPPGMEYGAAIIQGIETSRALVLILSEHSNDSHFVRKEVERAVSKTKPVLPVRIREINPSGSLEFFISSAQWVDAWRAPMEQHLATLVHTVRALSSGGPLPQSSKLEPPKPAKSRVPLLAAIGAAVALLAGAGVYAWSPWQPAWQRSPAAFLEGTWCQPMSGTAVMRAEYKRSGSDVVDGEINFSNNTEIIRFRARVAPTADGIEYTFLQPQSWAESGPVRDKVVDHATKVQVFSSGKPEDLPTQTRCQPGSTGG
jgi:hypothetical protein